jgi:YihY family inner membrane protein
MDVKAPLRRFDRFQHRRPALSFPLAVVKKFSDDEGGSMVSLIAYRGFFSLFPLLLLLTTLLGYLLADDPSLRRDIVDSTLSQFPVIGDQLKGGELQGSGIALAVGIVGSLWAGLAVVLETELTFERAWGVPRHERRGFVAARLRAVALLMLLGGLSVLSTVAAGLASGGSDLLGPLPGIAIALGLNLALFAAVFHLLTPPVVGFRALLPGIAVAAVGWQLLQLIGGYYVSHQVKNATPVYGTFALVIGLLAWIHIGALFTVLGAEANVVREKKLWPRRLFDDAPSG